jgi:O-acetylserine/cysteine efflux transporter
VRPRHIGLAVAVAAVWGFNFVVLEIGLEHLSPLLFSALRFSVAALPALFIGRPEVRWRWIIAVGLILGVVKFTLLFVGMDAGMPAGLSSLVLQSQAIFTVVFGVVLLRERPGRWQYVGLAIAAAGIILVGARLGADRPALAFALVLAAAVAWGVSNVVVRRAAPTDMVRFMVWVSVVASPPLIVLSIVFDGVATDLAALRALNVESVAAVLYTAVLSTLLGWGAWGMLIRRYGASTVAPFSMLVPFFGIASGALVLGEAVHRTDIAGAALVVGGVMLGAIRRREPASGPVLEAQPAALVSGVSRQ